MVKKTILAVAGLIAVAAIVFIAVVALQPTDYRITRSATMAAPAEAVFGQVNDFHKWDAWSPWAKLDPNAKNSFEGPAAGTGAIFGWSGNDQIGEGRMTILESKPSELVRIKLDFVRPMADTSTVEFAFKPVDDKTSVAWTMIGRHQSFMSKAFCFVMNMDKMIGTDFEKGLASIKAIVESPPAKEKPPADANQKSGDPPANEPPANQTPVKAEN